METLDSLSERVMKLPAGQRLTLAHRILATMDVEEDPDVLAAWDREILARIQKSDADPNCALNGPDVLAELDKALKR